VQYNTPAAPLGLQIHGTVAQWGNRKGNWYRNIRIRPLRDDGTPILPAASRVDPETRGPGGRFAEGEIRFFAGGISGNFRDDFEIRIQDLSGREVERFAGRAGAFRHELKGQARGIRIVTVLSPGRNPGGERVLFSGIRLIGM